jgi:uncharacterized protein (DUF983 family)
MALLKGTKIYSIFTGKCPVCHNESMYKNSNPYKLRTALHMHERCGHCNTKYSMEPSFFYGAMYVSYGVNIILSITAFLITNILFGGSLMQAFLSIVGTILIFFPVTMRVSRNIWINLFMKYDRDKDAFAKG